ncbi:MAG: hypothetical protein ALECFALPRED_000647 [Alectoria fallacina]|uniref:Uncharacterized protein n=1 Tax=Alectoria fallacina TaxID=1903189 RepID=A0A8H3F937_9LECA|nr:MAG: hypothetical protein ALECFALPRED_000647 [Alectoria fallacina]
MLVLLFTSFTLPLSSALTLDNPLPLLLPPPASAANNNTPMPMPMPNAPLPTAAAPHVSYICNGNAFGYGLDNDSCAQSVALVGISTTVLTFGMRSSAGRAYDIELPQRFISTDGKCVIEPSLTPGATEASASAEDIAVAAFVVVRNCVGGEGATGGIAKDIVPNGDDRLRVFVSKYDPDNVRCYGKMPPAPPDARVSCRQILNTMDADGQHTAFGPASDPEAEVGLPLLLVSSDQQCKMTIRTTGKGAGHTDTWSWGQFWEVGIALAGMCVREGKEGVQTRLGDNGWLYMEVGGPQTGLLQGNVTVA